MAEVLYWPGAAWELQGSCDQPVGISPALRWRGKVYGPHGLWPLLIIQLPHPESWSPAGNMAEGLVRTCCYVQRKDGVSLTARNQLENLGATPSSLPLQGQAPLRQAKPQTHTALQQSIGINKFSLPLTKARHFPPPGAKAHRELPLCLQWKKGFHNRKAQ